MFVYFDENGVLKEIITEKNYRVGDSKRDKLYIYWDGQHSPYSGWIKYKLPNGSHTVEAQFFNTTELADKIVGMPLPTKPLRNLKYFSYDHTYEENGEIHTGYKFYEIEIPDEVLNSSLDDEDITPTENNLVVARIRFVIEEGPTYGENIDNDDSIQTMGAIPFSVETNIGIITDSSINVTQYNYLLKVIERSQGVFINPVDEPTEEAYSIKVGGQGTFSVASMTTNEEEDMWNNAFDETPQDALLLGSKLMRKASPLPEYETIDTIPSDDVLVPYVKYERNEDWISIKFGNQNTEDGTLMYKFNGVADYTVKPLRAGEVFTINKEANQEYSGVAYMIVNEKSSTIKRFNTKESK